LWNRYIFKETVPETGTAPKKLILRYDSPAPDTEIGWRDNSLPIGNGYQGVNIFGCLERERLQLSEETLWRGGPIADGGIDTYNKNAAFGNTNRAGDLATPKLYQQARSAALGKAGDTLPPDNFKVTGSPASPMYDMYPTGRAPLGDVQNFSEVYLSMTHSGKTLGINDVNNYVRWLDIENAVAGVDYNYNGAAYSREYFASYPGHVVVARFNASKPGKLNFTLNPTIAHTGTANTGKTGTVTAVDSTTIEMSGKLNQNGLKFAAQFKVILTGGTSSTTTIGDSGAIQVTEADSAIVLISYGTDYVNDYDKEYRTGIDPMPAVRARVQAAANKGYDALKAEHIADYREIFGRVELDLGGKPSNLMTDKLLSEYMNDKTSVESRKPNEELYFLEELYFHYGRYLLIASSRQGSLPAHLQGVWNVYNVPPWQSDYHLNINLQMNYWPANNTNMKETLYTLVDYMDSLRKPGRSTAKAIFGVGTGTADLNQPEGCIAFLSSNPFGFTGLHNARPSSLINPGQPQYSPESSAWMMQNIYNMYQYYPDEDYLRNKIYPIMREAALFYSDPEILVPDPASGRMVMSPTFSSEHGPMWGGNTFQQQLLWQLFTDVLEASEILGVDGGTGGFREKLKSLIPKLSEPGKAGPVPIGPKSGRTAVGSSTPASGIKEWCWATAYTKYGNNVAIPSADGAHRHLSHLVGLFPGNLITKDTQAWVQAAKGSLNARGDGATGWSRGMKINLWARTGDGNHAYKIFDGLIRSATLPNLWDFHEGPHFQIDGNLGGTAGMVEMLMQSHAGYIEPLAALPDAWPSGSVKGITMRGGFTVDMKWANKKVTSLEITSTAGKPCFLKLEDFATASIREKNGSQITLTKDPNRKTVKFNTVKGTTYAVQLK
jgi:alpha-L-fucosidase 2